MGRATRTGVALFDAAVMSVAAFEVTGARGDQPLADVVLWGSAIAAAAVAAVVAVDGPSVVAWIGIGYVLYAGLLATAEPSLVIVALALALMPVAPRPRGSLALGVAVATVAAFAAAEALARLVGSAR